jgi:hypothetical protein
MPIMPAFTVHVTFAELRMIANFPSLVRHPADDLDEHCGDAGYNRCAE